MKTDKTTRKNIFVAGTWNEKIIKNFSNQAFELGKEIAWKGFNLTCGPGTGISRHVIDGFRSIPNRPGKVTFYLPSPGEMKKVGEKMGNGADKIIRTKLNYPMRNILQISRSNGVIILTGGDGTLEEAITALADYHLPVAVYRGSGAAAKSLELLLPLFPEWKRDLFFGRAVSELVKFVHSKIYQ